MTRSPILRARRLADRARARRISLLPGVTVGPGSGVGPAVRVRVAPGGVLRIGSEVYLDEGVVISVSPGAVMEIGDGCFAGHHTTLAAHEHVAFGAGCFLAELVSVRDHDHVVGRPPRSGGLVSDPVVIGADSWIGAKATVLRGVRVGEGAVIGAHALVRSEVPPRTVAAGVPARTVRSLDQPGATR